MYRISLYLLIILVSSISATDYYVSNNGNDNSAGTVDNPFLTIQKAADVMSAGDICYIRQGNYHEVISMNNNDGSESAPLIFSAYENERVLLDGTVLLGPSWEIYSGNIWKTTLDFPVWQLFSSRQEMIMARWPNANFEDGSIWDKENHWGHGTID
ncbi:MAG: hypothetical protein P8L91_02225, partial [Candidatus Marinimicrobia bacterium]|nr:hypothetical protein [Candidatus Neomarinimicrobiota bacterium]